MFIEAPRNLSYNSLKAEGISGEDVLAVWDLDFHDNDLQFMITNGAISNLENRMHGKLITARFIFPKRHLTLHGPVFMDACIYVTLNT